MADFLNQVFHSSVPFNQTIQLINQNRNFKSIYNRDNKYHDTFQSHINSLSSPTRRVHGFLLIQEYLMEMPNELLGENFKIGLLVSHTLRLEGLFPHDPFLFDRFTLPIL
ncbi:uncharacterized protein LOC128385844 [Panonychus citri]|uniref:uncharacterized protein LOC128385844 n=1 Tax=Panonychus citri TaxID=50023 RepID=UPI002307C322|nr:uncharacterized protein LOC128385844 [Panonychus citri]